jgi:hypothetical protein
MWGKACYEWQVRENNFAKIESLTYQRPLEQKNKASSLRRGETNEIHLPKEIADASKETHNLTNR